MSVRTYIDRDEFYSDTYSISCRTCQHFIRVEESGWRSVLRGFCERGGSDGADFNLYISSSYAKECKCFEFDPMKGDLRNKENTLSEMFDGYRSKSMRRLMEGFANKPQDYMIQKWDEELKAERFRLDHTDEMMVINNAFELKRRDYDNLMARTRDMLTNAAKLMKKPHLFEPDSATVNLEGNS